MPSGCVVVGCVDGGWVVGGGVVEGGVVGGGVARGEVVVPVGVGVEVGSLRPQVISISLTCSLRSLQGRVAAVGLPGCRPTG